MVFLQSVELTCRHATVRRPPPASGKCPILVGEAELGGDIARSIVDAIA